MLSILFWNVNGQKRGSLIASLASQSQSDVIIVAEQEETAEEVLTALNLSAVEYSYAPNIGNTKLHLYVRFAEELAAPYYETDRLTIRRVQLPGLPDFLLAAVHFPSKYAWGDASQTAEAFVLAADIRSAERAIGHERTILVGDLNMNPFEDGVVSAAGLHGVMTKALASKGGRTVQERYYPYFYNPMWSFLGDHYGEVPGTFFYAQSEQRVLFWHTFDQVLVRPSMLQHFASDRLQVVTEVNGLSLLTAAGLPNKNIGSDHLPLTFALH